MPLSRLLTCLRLPQTSNLENILSNEVGQVLFAALICLLFSKEFPLLDTFLTQFQF